MDGVISWRVLARRSGWVLAARALSAVTASEREDDEQMDRSILVQPGVTLRWWRFFIQISVILLFFCEFMLRYFKHVKI